MRTIKRFLVRGVKATDDAKHEDLFYVLSNALSFADSVFRQGYDVTVINTKDGSIIRENRHDDK